MNEYEIWGPNDDGDETLLDSRTGELPAVGDDIEVADRSRTVEKVSKLHQADGTSVWKVSVGQYDDGEPMPILFG